MPDPGLAGVRNSFHDDGLTLPEPTTTPRMQKFPRALEFALFTTAMIWAVTAFVVAGRAAAGIAGRFGLSSAQSLLNSLFLLFLVVIGFRMLDFIATRGAGQAEILPLPRRATSAAEWATGAAIGWAMCLAAVLPALLSAHLHARLNRGAGVLPAIVFAVLTLLVFTLAEEVIFRGYPFRRLSSALSPAWASVLLSLLFAFVLVVLNPPVNTGVALLNLSLFGIVLALAYLRTHALWLGWGLHFAYRAVMAVLLGLPIAGHREVGALLDAGIRPPRSLSGGGFGLDAALFTSLVLLTSMAVLYRITREWAWAYTTPEIVPAGYAVDVAPPAAHVAMERSTAVAPPPLVQIMPSTSHTFSAGEGTIRAPKD